MLNGDCSERGIFVPVIAGRSGDILGTSNGYGVGSFVEDNGGGTGPFNQYISECIKELYFYEIDLKIIVSNLK